MGLINGHSYFKKIREDNVLTKTLVSRAEVLIKKLIKKQIEIVVLNEDVGDYLINKMGLGMLIKKSTFKVTELSGSETRLGFSKDALGTELLKQFDQFIKYQVT